MSSEGFFSSDDREKERERAAAATVVKTLGKEGQYLTAFTNTLSSATLFLTLKVLVATIDAQWEGMGDVGSASRHYFPHAQP